MRRQRLVGYFIAIILCALSASIATAAHITSEQAQTAVRNWLGKNASPMNEKTGNDVLRVETHYANGSPSYYAVFLNPKGLVIVPADDRVEPVVGFFPDATSYDPSPENPLGALIHGDLTKRVQFARQSNTGTKNASFEKMEMKWKGLVSKETSKNAMATPADVRVEPLVKTMWAQTSVGDIACYDYETPLHYPSGCVATAMAQIMRFHEYPRDGVGTKEFSIKVDGGEQTKKLLGGNEQGGPYNWGLMPYDPTTTTLTYDMRIAIGRIMHDAGVSVGSSYTKGSTSAVMFKHGTSIGVSAALTDVFRYRNAILALDIGGMNNATLETLIDTNLDAGMPIILTVLSSSNANGEHGYHAIVCDGYGFQSDSLYHHINMGWGGNENGWYSLPAIGSYSSIGEAIYNIFPDKTGEIISGRVYDADGIPINGTTITLESSGFTQTTTTNTKGIYAFYGIPSRQSFTITPSREGFSFTPSTRNVTTDKSRDSNPVEIGNKGQIDFIAKGCNIGASPMSLLLFIPMALLRTKARKCR